LSDVRRRRLIPQYNRELAPPFVSPVRLKVRRPHTPYDGGNTALLALFLTQGMKSLVVYSTKGTKFQGVYPSRRYEDHPRSLQSASVMRCDRAPTAGRVAMCSRWTENAYAIQLRSEKINSTKL
jgi:hypothetical protein